jgi:hypothetical protein
VSVIEVMCNVDDCGGYFHATKWDDAAFKAWETTHQAACPTPVPLPVRRLRDQIAEALEIARHAEHEHLRWEEPLWPVPSWVASLRRALDAKDDHCDCSQCLDAPRRIKRDRGIDVERTDLGRTVDTVPTGGVL